MKTGSHSCTQKPHTKLGWWALGLAAAFVILFLINSFVFMPTTNDAPWRHVILPYYGIFMLLCGIASGILGLLAITKQHERSGLVLLTLVPGVWVLFMLVGELLFPH
jgi:uncharacterized membrane protein